MPKDNLQSQTDQAYKSLLYWRKSLLAGTQCVPVIMTLERDVLSMKTSDGVVVFAVSRSERTVKFTGWGTMRVTVGEKRYDFVGMPASESPAVSESQIAELAQIGDGAEAKNVTKTSTLNAVATATIASGTPSAAGAAASTGMYYHGLTSMYEWKELIGSAADQKLRFNNMTYAIVLIVIIVVVAIALK